MPESYVVDNVESSSGALIKPVTGIQPTFGGCAACPCARAAIAFNPDLSREADVIKFFYIY